MARRKDHTREELKKMSVTAARNIIIKHGFSELSSRKVATEIGYTVGTLYNVFTNFDDLILHVNYQTLDDLQVYIEKNTPAGLTGEKGIKKLAHTYLNFAHDNLSLWRALAEHNLPEGEKLPDWYSQKTDALFDKVEVMLMPEVSADKDEARRQARVLWASVHGVTTLALSGKLALLQSEPVHMMLDTLIENFMQGLKSQA